MSPATLASVVQLRAEVVDMVRRFDAIQATIANLDANVAEAFAGAGAVGHLLRNLRGPMDHVLVELDRLIPLGDPPPKDTPS